MDLILVSIGYKYVSIMLNSNNRSNFIVSNDGAVIFDNIKFAEISFNKDLQKFNQN